MLEIFSRVAGAAGIVSLALLAAGLVTFPLPTTGAAAVETNPAAVNRTVKADRLPSLNPAVWQSEFETPLLLPSSAEPLHSQRRTQIPPGCDPAFSPISSPRLANVIGRCVT